MKLLFLDLMAHLPYLGANPDTGEAVVKGLTAGGPADMAIVVTYFVGIVLFGLYFGRYAGSTKDYFFGGQRFAWWLIAFSAVATTVGSYSFIKYSQVGFQYGISSTQSFLNDWFWVPILILVWLPIIYFQRIQSVPEYFERRFGTSARVAATLFLLVYLVGYVGVNLVTLGIALRPVLGWPVFTGAAVTCVLVTVYVYVGGQTSVIMTDLAQGIILLIAGLGVFLAGVLHVGGFIDFWALLPRGHRFAFSEFAAPDDFSFAGIYMQDGLANTGAFILMNQGMIMRFLSMRSVKDARRMVVLWILVLAPLAAIAVSGAGWIGPALLERGDLQVVRVENGSGNELAFGTVGSDVERDTAIQRWRTRDEWMTKKEMKSLSEKAFIAVTEFLCYPGVFGLVLAALLAALMSTADTLINAVSAVFVNDIYRPYLRKDATDKHYLLVARVASLSTGAVGLALVPLFMNKSIYSAHGMFTAAVTPPIVMAILMGVFWRRFNPPAALATLIGGGLLVAASFVWPDVCLKPFSFGMGPASHDFTRAFFGLAASGVLGVLVALATKPQPAQAIAGLVTGTQLDAMRVFKGGEINRRPGKQAFLNVVADDSLPESDPAAACAPQSAMDIMAARVGDLAYVCDRRWWLGGLRSAHLRIVAISPDEYVHVRRETMASAHFADGDAVYLEKEL